MVILFGKFTPVTLCALFMDTKKAPPIFIGSAQCFIVSIFADIRELFLFIVENHPLDNVIFSRN